MTQLTYGLIGRGRLAAHMAHYLRLEEQPCFVWHRGLVHSPENILSHCDVIVLLINDDALSSFVEAHPFLRDKTTLHFSGCRVIESISGLHPVMTFGPDLYDLQVYREIPFVEEAGGKCSFGGAFPTLNNPCWQLDPELKPLYHALCVLGGNGTALLASRVFEEFEERLGLPRIVLEPLLRQSLANICDGNSTSLTGPWVRNDTATIDQNLEALKNQSLSDIYRVFLRAYQETKG